MKLSETKITEKLEILLHAMVIYSVEHNSKDLCWSVLQFCFYINENMKWRFVCLYLKIVFDLLLFCTRTFIYVCHIIDGGFFFCSAFITVQGPTFLRMDVCQQFYFSILMRKYDLHQMKFQSITEQ